MGLSFVAVLVSADGARTLRREISAVDIDAAAAQAIEITTGGELGARSSWFVGAVVQEDLLYQVSAAIEALI